MTICEVIVLFSSVPYSGTEGHKELNNETYKGPNKVLNAQVSDTTKADSSSAAPVQKLIRLI